MPNKADETLRETLLKSDLPSIMESVGEISIDSLMNEGILREVPILGTIASIGKVGCSVRDFIFTKKLMSFLKSVSSLSEAERKDMMNKLEGDDAFGKYAGERLLDLLSRLDDVDKPVLVGKALKAYAKGKYDATQLKRICYAIDRLLMCDIDKIKEFVNADPKTRSEDDSPVFNNFINSGLAYSANVFGGNLIEPSQTCKDFLVHVLEENVV